MRITIYDNGEVHAPDKLIGYVGETNHREIEFDYTDVTGATNYELRLLYPDGYAYLAPIVNKAVTVTGSMLPAAGRIKGQWLAYAVDSDEEFTLVAKSEMFELLIGESIGDDVEPVPTYEATLSVVQQLIETGMTKEEIITAIQQIIETGEVEDLDTGFVTTLKETNHGIGITLWVGTNAEYQNVSPKAENTLYIRTDVDDLATLTAAVEALSSTVSGHTTSIGNLQTTVGQHTTAISALQTATTDSGWTSLTVGTGWTGTVKARKIGSLVHIVFDIEWASGTNQQIASLTSAIKPEQNESVVLPTNSSIYYAPVTAYATGGGIRVGVAPESLDGLELRGSLTYFVG